MAKAKATVVKTTKLEGTASLDFKLNKTDVMEYFFAEAEEEAEAAVEAAKEIMRKAQADRKAVNKKLLTAVNALVLRTPEARSAQVVIDAIRGASYKTEWPDLGIHYGNTFTPDKISATLGNVPGHYGWLKLTVKPTKKIRDLLDRRDEARIVVTKAEAVSAEACQRLINLPKEKRRIKKAVVGRALQNTAAGQKMLDALKGIRRLTVKPKDVK